MMLEQSTIKFIEQLSSAEPVPGGGGASAAVGAFSTALGMMVANLTIGKKKYADVEAEVIEVKNRLQELQNQCVSLTDQDAESFAPLAKAYSLPKEERELVMESALYEASVVPIQIMETILQGMQCMEVLGEKGSRLAISDVGVGILFAQAALEGASLNVFINTRMMQDRDVAERLNHKADSLIAEGNQLKQSIYENVLHAIR